MTDILPPGYSASWCCSHHVMEPVPPNAYRVCFECGHVYPTAESLVEADRVLDAQIRESCDDFGPEPLPVPADEILSCPECLHDF